MKLRVILEPSDEGGFTALVPALPGCFSEGETKAEALAKVEEAIRLYLESVEDDLPLAPGAEVTEIAFGSNQSVSVSVSVSESRQP